MCLAQGHNAVTPVRLEPTAPQPGVKHSTTVPPFLHVWVLKRTHLGSSFENSQYVLVERKCASHIYIQGPSEDVKNIQLHPQFSTSPS